MNAIELLMTDHEKVDAIFDQLKGDPATRAELTLLLEQELKIHSQIEESIFYPALQTNPETSGIVAHSFKEHDEVDQLLLQLKEAEDEPFLTKLQELEDAVHHHVEEEEGELFPKAKKILGEARLEELGTQMEQMKKSGLKAA